MLQKYWWIQTELFLVCYYYHHLYDRYACLQITSLVYQSRYGTQKFGVKLIFANYVVRPTRLRVSQFFTIIDWKLQAQTASC